MANAVNSNTVYVDATGSISTTKNAKVYSLWFTPGAADDELLLTDGNGGANKIYVRSAVAKTTLEYTFGSDGVNFPNGLYVTTITSGAKAILLVSGV